MGKIRVTEGQYVTSGERFRIVDDFLQKTNAHRMLHESWMGRTTFHEAPGDYVEDVVRQGGRERPRVSWADLSEDHDERLGPEF